MLLLTYADWTTPIAVWDRPKHGFHVPLDRFVSSDQLSALESALDWREAHVDLFDYRNLRSLHAQNLSIAIGRELWNPFVLLAWAMADPRSI
jgi:hypothetical protein